MATALHHEEHEEFEGNPTTPVDTMISAYPFFTVLAHGIARLFVSFMVNSPVWQLPMSFVV